MIGTVKSVGICQTCIDDVTDSQYFDVTINQCGRCKQWNCEHQFRYGPEDGPICTACDS